MPAQAPRRPRRRGALHSGALLRRGLPLASRRRFNASGGNGGNSHVMTFLVATRIRRYLALWGVSSGALAYAGPFGTFASMALSERVLFWGTVIGSGLVLGAAVERFFEGRVPRRPALPRALAMGAVMALAFTPVLQLLKHLFLQGRPAPLGPVESALVVFAVPLAVAGLRVGLDQAQQPRPEGHSDRPEVSGARAPGRARAQGGGGRDGGEGGTLTRLLDRIEPRLRAPLVSISGQDHFIEIRTDAGRAEVRMRLADALRELDGAPGLRVHRSHWVAERAVRGVEQGGPARLWLHLHDGRRLPVSRPYRDSVLGRFPEVGGQEG